MLPLDGQPVGQIDAAVGELIAEIGVLPTSAGAIIAVIVLAVVFGKIPTLRELRDSQEREKRAMQLAENWQKVATEHGMTLSQIADGLEVANHALTEIQSALETYNKKAR